MQYETNHGKRHPLSAHVCRIASECACACESRFIWVSKQYGFPISEYSSFFVSYNLAYNSVFAYHIQNKFASLAWFSQTGHRNALPMDELANESNSDSGKRETDDS